MTSPNEPATYRNRLIDAQLIDLLQQFPAILINGPRATGKTTTARRHANTEIRLDQPAQAAAFIADPDAALRDREEPVLLDEWQEVPQVLGAVKRAVDDRPRPGRFILTGSVRSDLENKMWPGTGRLIRTRMYGLTEREYLGVGSDPATSFLEKLQTKEPASFTLPSTRLDLRGYIEVALRGGFPGLVFDDASMSRDIWVDSYLDQLLTRDGISLIGGHDEHKLARYFEALAANSAGIPEHKTLYDAAGINRVTANAYDRLLEQLYVSESIPAWASNRIARLTKTPKRYVVDGALMASALSATVDTVLNDSDLLGRTIDTLIMAQLRPEIAIAMRRMRVHHLRTKNGREEIDIVIEVPGGQLIAIEIKASAAPTTADAKHIKWLRDQHPDRFMVGAVLHTGPDVIKLDDDILATPISAFWGQANQQ